MPIVAGTQLFVQYRLSHDLICIPDAMTCRRDQQDHRRKSR